jgi:hypothetical protein
MDVALRSKRTPSDLPHPAAADGIREQADPVQGVDWLLRGDQPSRVGAIP